LGPARARDEGATPIKPVLDGQSIENSRQADDPHANGDGDRVSNDKAPPPVVNTQTAANEETAEVAPVKAAVVQDKPDAAASTLPAPLPVPSTQPREASPLQPRQQPVPSRPGAPMAPGQGSLPRPPAPLTDPHQRLAPTATGALLNVPPGESIAERALDLGVRLAAAEADRQALEARITQLTTTLQAREQELQTASKEVQEATDEVLATRQQLQTWRQELEDARIRSQKQKREDLEKMKALIVLMEKVLANGSSSGPGPGDGGSQKDKETRRQGDKETRRQEQEKNDE
jgi:hypothetical protein